MNTSKKRQNTSLIEELRQLLVYIDPRRRVQLVLLFFLMVLSSLSEMVSLGAIFPFLSAMSNPEILLSKPELQPVLTFLQIQTPKQLVTSLSIGFMITVLLASGLRLLTLHCRVRLAAAIGADVSSQIYHITLNQPYSFHVNHNTSDLMQTVTGDTQALTSRILMPLLALANDALLAPGLIITLVFIDAKVAVGATVVLGGAYIIIYRTRQKLLKQNSRIVVESGQKRIKAVQEGIGGIRDVLLNHSQKFFENSYLNSERALKKATSTNAIIAQSPKFIIEAIAMCAIILFALNLGNNGDFSRVVPVLGSLVLGAKKLLPTFQEGFTALAGIQGSRAALSKVLVSLKRSINPLSQANSLPTLSLEKGIRLDNIWFSYGGDTSWVLQGLNLTISAKTTVAFVGSTGSGKSTTVDLILGLLQPQKGQILVDDVPLEGKLLYPWQKNIAHVPQSIFLSDGSIAENIAFAIPYHKIDLAQVRKAARLAQVDEFIESLPAKYDTYVGERGIRLSGGQRQRIGIARALYGDASVIVFDEATSALDNATEKEVMSAIEGLSHQFTIILIAHRLSTVEKCDRIFELSQGKVIAEGTYQELLENSHTFKRMATTV
jgi:ATP-binding cassette subfamily B protein